MKSRYRNIAFVVYAICILGFLSMMIINQNQVFHEGTAYNFKCEPVDPTDPFRGKYVRLRFQDIRIEHRSDSIPKNPYFGVVQKDKEGYAFINSLIENPGASDTYIELDLLRQEPTHSTYSFPIDRLYMNENKALQAEELYRNALRDSTQNVYAKVYINAGRYILDDVYVDGVRLKNMVE